MLLPPGRGEIIGDSPERRVEILSDLDELNATTSRFAAGRDGADLHVHRLHTDFFYVLEGELTVRLGVDDQRIPVTAGTLVRVPPLVVHGFRNSSDADMRFLNFHAPGRQFVDYLRAMRDRRRFSYDQYDPPEDGGRPTSEAAIGEVRGVVERAGLRVVLLTDVEAIEISEIWSEPGAVELPPALRERGVRSFYVLEGEVTFAVEDVELPGEAGAWVQIPSGASVTAAVTDEAPARFLGIRTPGG